jgi:hypothetical protein
MRQPRRERSPGLDPLFDRCSASGAPQSLQTNPTHDWLSDASGAFFAGAELFVMALLNILPQRMNRPRVAIVVLFNDLSDLIEAQLFHFRIDVGVPAG